ncbi:MAG: hypothetical protein KBT53_07535 [Porticoccus sp.]|nr:hypothetical protein [Porticoccus sp.]MBQ0808102.1 hypothetical protein [Porticoccus sp.]
MMYFDKGGIFQKKTRETNTYQNPSCHFSLLEWPPTHFPHAENERSKTIQKKMHPESTCCPEGKETTQSVDIVEVLGNFAQAGM